jgi:hypothetical protein
MLIYMYCTWVYAGVRAIRNNRKKKLLFFEFLFWSQIRIRRKEEEVNIHREHTEDTPQTKHRG